MSKNMGVVLTVLSTIVSLSVVIFGMWAIVQLAYKIVAHYGVI